MPEFEIKDIITLAGLLIAALALIINPLTTKQVSKRQVIAPMRQAWINSLRERISEIVSYATISRVHVCPSTTAPLEIKERAEKEDRERYQEIKRLAAIIELHLNPNEKSHVDLTFAVNKLVLNYHSNKVDQEAIDQILKTTKTVLKQEWEITKKT